jgi:hypothetical protein
MRSREPIVLGSVRVRICIYVDPTSAHALRGICCTIRCIIQAISEDLPVARLQMLFASLGWETMKRSWGLLNCIVFFGASGVIE